MSRFHKRRWAHYGRNQGREWSKSANASNAEAAGRWPRTKAAAVLGVSVKAFDAGVQAMNYRTREWHHVGKYATMVDYWDTDQCREDSRFWRGAATAHNNPDRVAELLAKADDVSEYNDRDEVYSRDEPVLTV